MVRQRFSIQVRGKKWHITAFYPITRYDVNVIMHTLYSIDCSNDDLRKAYENLTNGQLNNGLTFSNYLLRETVVVFSWSTEPAQYFNLIVHELHHLSVHIALANGYDLEEEEVCYINGDVAQAMYPVCRKLFK